jgi:hypothetical protein
MVLFQIAAGWEVRRLAGMSRRQAGRRRRGMFWATQQYHVKKKNAGANI